MDELKKNESLEIKKTKFFARLALSAKDLLKLHRDKGELWKKDATGKREWGNVSEHCLVEVARANVLADELRLEKDLKKDLASAALLHDYYKKHEILAFKEALNKPGSKTLNEARRLNDAADEHLLAGGVKERVIDLRGAAGGYPHTLVAMKDILDKEKITDEELAKLVLNYIDAYTNNYDWSEPATIEGEVQKNDVDRKGSRITSSANYAKSETESRVEFEKHPFFRGMASADALVTISRLIEDRLTKVIKERSNRDIEPVKLPEHVDEEIRKRILDS